MGMSALHTWCAQAGMLASLPSSLLTPAHFRPGNVFLKLIWGHQSTLGLEVLSGHGGASLECANQCASEFVAYKWEQMGRMGMGASSWGAVDVV